MITLKISGRNYELTPKIISYTNKKIGSLSKWLPKGAKECYGQVTLSLDQSGREDNQCVCEVTIQVPGGVLQSKEATLNMFAAVDIVEAKLKTQAVKYKDKHHPSKRRRQIFLDKLLRRYSE
jgi:putative sigma-54 modulation protein